MDVSLSPLSSTLPSSKYSLPTNSYRPSSSSRLLTIFNPNSGVSKQFKFRFSSKQPLQPLVKADNGSAEQFRENSSEQQTAKKFPWSLLELPFLQVNLFSTGRSARKHEEFLELMEKVRAEEERKLEDTQAKVLNALEDELSRIVGLDELKLQLQTWAKGMLLNERRRSLYLTVDASRPPHMAFLGNPGTGKTMVARILGKILHIVGLLPTDKVTEVQRSDLVSKWIGGTANQTREKIEQAMGGILFVDEAYRLRTLRETSGWKH